MQCKKTWFYYFSISFSIVGLMYIFVCGLTSLGAGQEYPYLPKGMLVIGLFLGWMLISFLAKLTARLDLYRYLPREKKSTIAIEAVFVGVILVAAFILRIVVIGNFPIEPASDFKTYYEIADLLLKGTIQKEGKGYCEYIAMFPHVVGYCYVLKNVFAIFGNDVIVGQYFNIVLSVGTCFIMYRIGRKLGGRIAGAVLLLLCAFWPSQVLYITMLSAEYVFTFLLYLAVWLFLSLMMDYGQEQGNLIQCFILHIVLGILIALTAAVRPMAQILLIAIVLCLLPQKMEMPNRPENDIPVMLRVLKNGWVRCLLIAVPYMIISGIISTNIELLINKNLPSGSTSFGYNLLVGLNTESIGGWNEDDKNLLYDTMEASGSASQAHIACRDLAITRLVSNPTGILNLFLNKYELLWGNDDYGSTWNIAFLDEQGNLTKERSDFLYSMRDYNNIIYMITIFFSLLALIYFLKKKGNYAFICILLYLGTVAMHLLVESQNRYHYFVLEVFMLLAAMGIQYIFDDAKAAIPVAFSGSEPTDQHNQQIMEIYEQAEKDVTRMREEALANVFDMQYALEQGHIIMTVSEAYEQDDADGQEEMSDDAVRVEAPIQTEEAMAEESDQEEPAVGEEVPTEALIPEALITARVISEKLPVAVFKWEAPVWAAAREPGELVSNPAELPATEENAAEKYAAESIGRALPKIQIDVWLDEELPEDTPQMKKAIAEERMVRNQTVDRRLEQKRWLIGHRPRKQVRKATVPRRRSANRLIIISGKNIMIDVTLLVELLKLLENKQKQSRRFIRKQKQELGKKVRVCSFRAKVRNERRLHKKN